VSAISPAIRQYTITTGNYWAFTLTDGALRMLVVLHFHQLGYSPLEIAYLFLFYEFFGIVTNLIGGWLGARIGLNITMNIGLLLQLLALAMLLAPAALLTVPWVMASQALSGIAKDLNKMSAKSAIKLLVPKNAHSLLFKWVAILTGSKNALKGVGFFLGALLLNLIEFRGAVTAMIGLLIVAFSTSLFFLQGELGKAKNKAKFSEIFSKSRAVNVLSAARLFLFAARDVWFVIALPVYFSSTLQWNHWTVGGFFALWVIGYGLVQALAPRLMAKTPDQQDAVTWALILSLSPAAMATVFFFEAMTGTWLVTGLLIFGVLFAINSSLHSFLIVDYAREDGVSMDVGFYYMANALGRLIGTVLSGWVFQMAGLAACLWVSTAFVIVVGLISLFLPKSPHSIE
jgi:predicted MFS family arabinose efflux permease